MAPLAVPAGRRVVLLLSIILITVYTLSGRAWVRVAVGQHSSGRVRSRVLANRQNLARNKTIPAYELRKKTFYFLTRMVQRSNV
jgi:hypothetical protein